MTKYYCWNPNCGNTFTKLFTSDHVKDCKKCGGQAKRKKPPARGVPVIPTIRSPRGADSLLHRSPQGRSPSRSPVPSTSGSSGPRVDLNELGTQIQQRQQRVLNNSRVNRTLTFTMAGPAFTHTFNMPVKYQLWKSDLSRQSPEITIKIPVKVYSGSDALPYWRSKGYGDDQFQKTVHGNHLGVAGAAFSDAVRKQWSEKVTKCWGKVGVAWSKPSGQEVLYGLKFEFEIVDRIEDAAAGVCCVQTTGAAHTTNPTGTIDAIRWGVDDTDPNTRGPICHEVGHLIGNPDEYYTITYNGTTKAWGNGYQSGDEYGIMNNPDHAPKIRNYKPLATELISAFNIPVTEAYLVEDIAMASTSARHKLSDHIWI